MKMIKSDIELAECRRLIADAFYLNKLSLPPPKSSTVGRRSFATMIHAMLRPKAVKWFRIR